MRTHIRMRYRVMLILTIK